MRPLALAFALSLVGCLAPSAELAPAGLPVDLPEADLVAHTAAGLVDLPPALQTLRARILEVGQAGGEPTIGVDSGGALYVTGGGARVLKSTDKGATWTDVADHSKPRRDMDPYLWLDPLTDRIFSAPLYVVCTNLMWSDDGGDSWEHNPLAGCGLPGHDHQSLSTGPPPEGVTTDGYPNVVYYAYNSFRLDGTRVTTSLDGGRTWGLDVKVADADDCQSSLNGAPAVAPDGTVYLPMPRCEGLLVGVSKDAGKTWTTRMIDGAGMLGVKPATPIEDTPFMANPAATVDSAGNAYVGWAGADGRFYLASSQGGGETWSAPVRVSPPEVNATVFAAAIASAPGRVALAYFGTTADTSSWKAPSAQFAPKGTVWNVYLSVTLDALAAQPTIATLQATPDDDPAQVGCVWLSGGVNDCRNLADFFDITEQAGRAYLVFADGCKKCPAEGQSTGRDLRVLVVDTGPSLAGQGDLVAYADESLAQEGSKAASIPRFPQLPLTNIG